MWKHIQRIELIAFVLSLSLAGIILVQKENDSTRLLRVYYLNVGQGDAIYIRTPSGSDILIDGGPDSSILNELGAVMPFWDRQIDLMILTHPHSDHVLGLIEVLRRYQVRKVLYTGALHTAPDYIEWLKEIKRQQIPLEIVDEVSGISLDQGIELKFLYPTKSFLNKKVLNLNNTSIVSQLRYNKTIFLFTGDIERDVESELLENDQLSLKSDVLKVAHHGSESSSSLDFIHAVSPSIAIISCGQDNPFNHPHGQTLFNLKNNVDQILRTDIEGRVSLFSDGEKIIRGE